MDNYFAGLIEQHIFENLEGFEERQKQVNGCFAFYDTLEEVQQAIENILHVDVTEMEYKTFADGKRGFKVIYDKKVANDVPDMDENFDLYVQKSLDNAVLNTGMVLVYLDDIKALREDIPYLEDV